MGRFYDEQAIHDFLTFIKTAFPTHFIRTNFIIGFPGETEEDFQKLQTFIKQDYFDNIALFEYHDEPLAASFQLPNKIPAKTIHARFRILRPLVNQLLFTRQQARQESETRGYVQNIYQDKKQTILSVRPRLHCPEIDEVDDIPLQQVTSCDDTEITIESRIMYTI
jgi:ribosomal protein S12 methylthiotransferase